MANVFRKTRGQVHQSLQESPKNEVDRILHGVKRGKRELRAVLMPSNSQQHWQTELTFVKFEKERLKKKNDDLTRLIESKTADFINEKNGLEQEIRQLSDNFEGVSNENNRLKERLAGLEMDNQKLRILNPQEDIWCSCNRQAFGEMIACDNRNCTIKWFHLECVSLTEAPKGKWFCPDCR